MLSIFFQPFFLTRIFHSLALRLSQEKDCMANEVKTTFRPFVHGRLLEVKGLNVNHHNVAAVQEQFAGEEGTYVNVTLVREGSTLQVALIRGKVADEFEPNEGDEFRRGVDSAKSENRSGDDEEERGGRGGAESLLEGYRKLVDRMQAREESQRRALESERERSREVAGGMSTVKAEAESLSLELADAVSPHSSHFAHPSFPAITPLCPSHLVSPVYSHLFAVYSHLSPVYSHLFAVYSHLFAVYFLPSFSVS